MKYFDYNTLYDGVDIYGNERIFEDHWFYDEDLNEDILFVGYIDLEKLCLRPFIEKYLIVLHDGNAILPEGYVNLPERTIDGKAMAKYSLKADLVLDEECELKPITKESPYYDLHSPENLFLIEKINEMKRDYNSKSLFNDEKKKTL